MSVFALTRLFSLGVPLGEDASYVDDIIPDHGEPDPAVHSAIAFVPATIEAMSPLGHTDAPLASGPPFLAVTGPALLLLAFAYGAFGRRRA